MTQDNGTPGPAENVTPQDRDITRLIEEGLPSDTEPRVDNMLREIAFLRGEMASDQTAINRLRDETEARLESLSRQLDALATAGT